MQPPQQQPQGQRTIKIFLLASRMPEQKDDLPLARHEMTSIVPICRVMVLNLPTMYIFLRMHCMHHLSLLCRVGLQSANNTGENKQMHCIQAVR